MNPESDKTLQSENFMICRTCGKAVDKRNPSQVLSHGVWDEETKAFVCYDVDGAIQFSSARRIE